MESIKRLRIHRSHDCKGAPSVGSDATELKNEYFYTIILLSTSRRPLCWWVESLFITLFLCPWLGGQILDRERKMFFYVLKVIRENNKYTE